MSRIGMWFSGHWKVTCLVMFVALASVSAVYAYWNLDKTRSSFTVSTFTAYPLELRIELNKTEFQEGEMISARISLKNISNRTVIVSFACALMFDFNVTDINGKVVYSWSLIKSFIQEVTPVILEPTTEISRTITQSVEDNFPLENQVPLPKGTYKLIGRTGLFGARYENWEYTGLGGRLETPPITITVN